MKGSINYETFPLLKILEDFSAWESFGLPLGGASKKGATYVTTAPSLKMLLKIVGTFSAQTPEPIATNIFVDSAIMEDFEDNDFYIPELQFDKIQDMMVGVICFGEGSQYVYMILPESMTQEIMKVSKRYFSIAFFQGSILGAFEAGFIEEDGISVDQESRYQEVEFYGPGGYLAAVLSILTKWVQSNSLQLIPKKNNQTGSKIYKFSAF